MHPFRHACLAAAIAAACNAAQADVAVPVTAVTLYPGSATVTRQAHVTPGATQLVIPGLPARFDAQTLRVQADAGIRIIGMTTQDAAQSSALNPAEAELEAKIQQLQDQQSANDAELKSAEIVQHYLERLNAGGTDDARGRVPMDAKGLSAMADALGRSASESLAKTRRIAIQKRDLDKKIDVLRRDLARLRSGQRDARTVTIALSAERAGDVALSYQVNSAGWRPAYRMAFNSATSRIELERMATIAQKSGEDWSNVKLVLSTGQPRQSPVAVDPQPWLLSWHEPEQPRLAMDMLAAPMAAPAIPVVAAYAGRAEPEAKAYLPPTFETQQTYATEFELPARASLASDGREVTIDLSSVSLPAKQYVRVAPRVERNGVLIAEVERPQGVWPQGTAQLFRDGSYVGSMFWNPRDGDRFELPFGRDEQVRVTVNEDEGKSGSFGLFDKRNDRRMVQTFVLTNAHNTALDVQVLESSPVSTADELKVKASFNPQPTIQRWKDRRGVVAWERKIGAGEQLKLSVDYQIDYPREGVVQGLP